MPRRHRRRVEVQLPPFFNFGARWGCVVNATPQPIYHRERDLGTYFTGGCLGPVAILDRCGKSRLHQESIPRPSSP